jgi:hypothetical protein
VAKGKVLRILACNFGVEGKFCSFKDWRRGGRRREGGREGGREENLEGESVLGFFCFLISVSFVINPVGGILSEEEKSVRDQRIAVDCIHVVIVSCCF